MYAKPYTPYYNPSHARSWIAPIFKNLRIVGIWGRI